MLTARRRAGFALSAFVLAALLFAFSAFDLLWMLLILLGAALALALLLRYDARRFSLSLSLASGGQVGQPLEVTLSATCRGPIFATAAIEVVLEMDHVMFGVTRRRTVQVPISRRAETFTFSLPAELCGETQLRCVRARLWDLLGVSCCRCAPCAPVRSILYPPATPLQLFLSRSAVNTAQAEGLVQNRRGSDLSETFDLRAYTPGDDIRAIHWKLSSKAGELILRQASEPFHYDVVLLPDLGLRREEEAVSASELNRAVSLTIALGEQLLRQGVSFCLALPAQSGLTLHEVRSLQALHALLPQWFGLELPRRSGAGLQYFLSEHLEQNFTRLLLVSAGPYVHDVSHLGQKISAAVLSADDAADELTYLNLSPFCEVVSLPTRLGEGTVRLVC